MTVTITRLFDDYNAARAAVGNLEAVGLSKEEISIVSNNADGSFSDNDPVNAATETGTGVGVLLGGAAGLLAELGLMVIPGLGPVVAAGWLVPTALGVGAGGIAGGIIGALIQSGVSDKDAHVFAEGVRRGGTLVTARVSDGDRDRYRAILDQGSVNLQDREKTYRAAGWNEFDPSAPPYSADQVRRDRDPRRTQSAA